MAADKKEKRGISMISILVVIVVSLVAAGLVIGTGLFLKSYKRGMKEHVKTVSSQTVRQVAAMMQNHSSNVNQMMDLLVENLNSPDAGRFYTAFLEMHPDVVAVTGYDENGKLLNCWSLDRLPRKAVMENLSFDDEISDEQRDYAISKPHVETIFEGYYPWVVTFTRKVEGKKGERWLALDLNFSKISTYINNVGIGQHGYCFLIDDEGSIIYHPQQQLIYSGIKTENTGEWSSTADGSYAGEKLIRSVVSVPNTSWRVVGISYVDELINKNMMSMLQITLMIVIAVLITTAVSSYIISEVLSRPLHSLSAEMENFEQNAGNYQYQQVSGTREVQVLSRAFGNMVIKIQNLMEKVRQEEISLRKTELSALQAQINPHFLYNTLDSITWMCEQEKTADAVKMVNALATLFRISISRGHELIPISKEIEHAKSYLQIQKYRYKNRFEYTFDVDPECEPYYCNKITLQPIIENSIYHGLDMMVEEGRIDVKICQDGGDVLFIVTDNGVGMSREQVEQLLEHGPQDRTGIGVKNVNDRLRICFGEEYGVSIESEPDEGTSVTMRMPKVKEGEYRER